MPSRRRPASVEWPGDPGDIKGFEHGAPLLVDGRLQAATRDATFLSCPDVRTIKATHVMVASREIAIGAGAGVSRYSRGARSWHVHAGPEQRLDQAIALKLLRDAELWPGVCSSCCAHSKTASAGQRPRLKEIAITISRAAQVGSGHVYIILRRLESEGWVASDWEQDPVPGQPGRRRFYQLTRYGKAAVLTALGLGHGHA